MHRLMSIRCGPRRALARRRREEHRRGVAAAFRIRPGRAQAKAGSQASQNLIEVESRQTCEAPGPAAGVCMSRAADARTINRKIFSQTRWKGKNKKRTEKSVAGIPMATLRP
jgi:hypothetical protein